ncbi:MAG: hypothetical protein ACOYNN_16345, partial [Terrimicrobiaceae bacterium]
KSARRELGGQKILGIVVASDLGGAVTRKRDVSASEAFERAVKDTVEAIVVEIMQRISQRGHLKDFQ